MVSTTKLQFTKQVKNLKLQQRQEIMFTTAAEYS